MATELKAPALFHRTWQLPPPLGAFVEHIWVARGHLGTPWRNAILPDGAVDLMVNLGDPQYLCLGSRSDRVTAFSHSWLSGERMRPIVIEELGRVNLLGVRFRPGGAWPILHMPVSEFTGHVVELDLVPELEMEPLRQQLAETPTDEARVRRMQSWLMSRFTSGTSATPAVRYALKKMGKTGLARIGQLVAEIGISHKQFLREFEKCVGLKPKAFARLRAFQQVIDLVGHDPDPVWADAAVTCGYHDQAHFIHEFQEFTGVTPSEYLRMRGPFLNYLTMS
jgi:AraC-like DNA-binding protein